MSKVIPLRQWAGSNTRTLTENWATVSRPTDYDIRTSLRILRARSRELAQNSDHVRGFLKLVSANVVGRQGVMLQAKVMGRSGKLDQRVNSAIEDAWNDWGKRGVAEITGQYSWKAVQRHVISTVARDGEAIVRVLEPDNGYSFALQLIDPETLDLDYNAALPNGEIRMGVELDGWRRPVAYYFTDEPSILSGSYKVGGKPRVRVSADEIIHIFLPEWNWQTRGIPWTATSLQRLYMLQGYEDAEITAARYAASKMGFYVPNMDAPDWSDKQEGDDFVQEVTPGQIDILPPGYNFQAFDMQHPTTQFGTFVKNCLRSISTGWGVSYNTVANDLEGVNYSSLRQGALSERDLWMELQDWFIEACCEPIYQRWLAAQLTLDSITAANGRPIPPERARDYAKVTWQARRWQWVDPEKEMNASKLAIELNLRSRSDIIRESGRDPEDVFAEIAAEHELMEQYGLDTETEPAAPAAPSADESADDKPGVTVNAGAVTVNTPPMTIRVEAPITVNQPPPPEIRVDAHIETPAPEITINSPIIIPAKASRVEKTVVERDAEGFPTRIVEQEIP